MVNEITSDEFKTFTNANNFCLDGKTFQNYHCNLKPFLNENKFDFKIKLDKIGRKPLSQNYAE